MFSHRRQSASSQIIAEWSGARSASLPLGFWGERRVVRFLERSGYRVIAQNWRSGRGELDIVAYRARTLIFIEVKTRRERVAIDYAPLDGVTPEKQRRIAKLSHRFIRASARHLRKLDLRHVRYDIIGVIYRGMFAAPRILHYRGAFTPDIAISLDGRR